MKSTVKTKVIKLVLWFNAQQLGLQENSLSIPSNRSADENCSDDGSSAVWEVKQVEDMKLQAITKRACCKFMSVVF